MTCELNYNELHHLISEMTDEQRGSAVKVRMSSSAKDSVIVKDLKVAETSLLDEADPEVFLVL